MIVVMTDRRGTPAIITMIPIIIAITIALAGFLIVNKITSDERSHCDELSRLFDDRDPLTPDGDHREVLDSMSAAC